MRIFIIAIALMFSVGSNAYAMGDGSGQHYDQSHAHDHGDGQKHYHERMLVDPSKIIVQPQQAVVQVKGIVCSFCSYGTEKNLSKLGFLDSTKFAGKGVLTDIKTGQTTLALKKGEAIDFDGIYKAVKEGGYEPVSVHFRLSGEVKRNESKVLIASTHGRLFLITGAAIPSLKEGEWVEFQVHLHGDDIPTLEKGHVIPVMMDRMEPSV